jgi:hypothetical protein
MTMMMMQEILLSMMIDTMKILMKGVLMVVIASTKKMRMSRTKRMDKWTMTWMRQMIGIMIDIGISNESNIK